MIHQRDIQPVSDPGGRIARKIRAEPGHPYAFMGWPGIAEALTGSAISSLVLCLCPVGAGNSLVPTGQELTGPPISSPITMTAGAGLEPPRRSSSPARLQGLPGETVSLHLRCRGKTLSLPRYGLEGLSALALARLLDEPPFRESLAEAIRHQWPGSAGRHCRRSSV
jgi:hypothetical protein